VRTARALAPAGVLVVLLAACTDSPPASQGEEATGEETGAATEPASPAPTPVLGACRILAPDDVARPSNSSPVVDCARRHTAETFAVGTFPDDVAPEDADLDDPELGKYAYDVCSERFLAFLGGDESAVMRSILTWAWFGPSADAWEDGARWYRCDAVGGADQSKRYDALPKTARGLLQAPPPDRWMVCADGENVAGSARVPCSEPHTWRAVTTIKLGQPDDPYPGDRVAEARTKQFCSSSVGAWSGYPPDYEFGYTWFHEEEWTAGNRRSICWAKTSQ
jgi:hypothetical protein